MLGAASKVPGFVCCLGLLGAGEEVVDQLLMEDPVGLTTGYYKNLDTSSSGSAGRCFF